MAKIFILEDDESISGLVKVALEMNGMTVKEYPTLKSFFAAAINVARRSWQLECP